MMKWYYIRGGFSCKIVIYYVFIKIKGVISCFIYFFLVNDIVILMMDFIFGFGIFMDKVVLLFIWLDLK